MSIKERIKKIKEQEGQFDIKIHLEESSIRDENHLDCIWYGGEVGYIKYKGYKIVIGAYGDIRIHGVINGEDVTFKDKNNAGDAFFDIAKEYNIDDKQFYELLDNPTKDNFLELGNSNWFEVDLITPEGEWYDLCDCDNIIENNVLDNFEGVSSYFEYVEMAIAEKSL